MASIRLNNQLRVPLRRVIFTGRAYTVEPPATIEPDTQIEFQGNDTGSVTYAVMPAQTQTGAVPWPGEGPAKQFTLIWRFASTGTPIYATSDVDSGLRLKLRERRNGVTYHLSARRTRHEATHPPHRGRFLRLPWVAPAAAAAIIIAGTALGAVGIAQGKFFGGFGVRAHSSATATPTPTATATPLPLVPATITITAPANNSAALATGPTTFTATAVDIHGNVLPDSAYTWKDDVDGALPSGSSSIQYTPTVKGGGACTITTHHITATALDPLEPGTPLTAAIAVRAYTGAACKLAITAPANNTTTTGQTVTFTASATDALGNAVAGSAIKWTDDLDGGLGTGASITHAPSVPGNPCTVAKHHVTASSAKLSATVAISTYSGAACQLKITAPGNNSNANAQSATTFTATATDALGKALAGSAISWSDDVDGGLGSGGSVQHTLSVTGGGACTLTKHHITASAGTPSATVTVSAYTGAACKLAITAPANNSNANAQGPTTFTATVTDAVGGPLSGSGIAWSDDVDGSLGTSGSVSHTLSYNGNYVDSLGYSHFSLCIFTKHTITATLNGLSGAITENAYSGVACNLTITAPSNNSVVLATAPVAFSATASDKVGHQLPGSVITWYESNTPLATGGAVNLSLSSSGCGVSHQIYAVANDNSADGISDVRYVTAYNGGVCSGAITAPTNGSFVDFASPTTLTAVANNAVGGPAAGATFAWTDSVDGYLGTGSTISHTFSGGPCVVASHVVTVYIQDSVGDAVAPAITVYTGYIC